MRTALLPTIVIVTLTVIGGVVIHQSAHLTLSQSFRIVLGAVYLLLAPGLVWSFVFFPNTSTQKTLDWTPRILFAVASSAAIVPMILFFASKLGVTIIVKNVMIENLIIIIAGLGTIFSIRYRSGKRIDREQP